MRRISTHSFFSGPFTSPRRGHSILEGRFNYNEAFAAFIAATRQKKETAIIVGAFGKKLQEHLPLSQTPLKVADFGCADGATGIQYLKNINCSSGFEYFGVDTNQKFLDEALSLVSQEPLIKKHVLINEDALSGKLSEHVNLSSHAFDLIFVSHTAYYLKDEIAGHLFIKDLLHLLSKKSGLALFLHEDTTHYYRSTYNPQFKRESTPTLLEKYSDRVTSSQQLQTVSFSSKLTFPSLSESLWEATKTPEEYKKHAHNTDFINTLNKLAFIVQRDLSSLAEEGTLTAYIDDIRSAIGNNNALHITTRMQVLMGPQFGHRPQMTTVLEELKKEIPLILEEKSHSTLSPSLK